MKTHNRTTTSTTTTIYCVSQYPGLDNVVMYCYYNRQLNGFIQKTLDCFPFSSEEIETTS